MTAIRIHPRFKLVEGLLPQRVKTPLAVGTHLHDAGLRQDPQVA